MNSTMTDRNPDTYEEGDRVTGLYYGRRFSGVVRFNRQNMNALACGVSVREILLECDGAVDGPAGTYAAGELLHVTVRT